MKRLHLSENNMLFLRSNARGHRSIFAMAKFIELGYILFRNMRECLSWKRFESDDKSIAQTNTYFEYLDRFYYLEGLNNLEKPWNEAYEAQSFSSSENLCYIKKSYRYIHPLNHIKSIIQMWAFRDKYSSFFVFYGTSTLLVLWGM